MSGETGLVRSESGRPQWVARVNRRSTTEGGRGREGGREREGDGGKERGREGEREGGGGREREGGKGREL